MHMGALHDRTCSAWVPVRAPSRGPVHGCGGVPGLRPHVRGTAHPQCPDESAPASRVHQWSPWPPVELPSIPRHHGRVAGSYSMSREMWISTGARSGGHSAHVQVKCLKPDTRGSQVRPKDHDAAQNGQLRQPILTWGSSSGSLSVSLHTTHPATP